MNGLVLGDFHFGSFSSAALLLALTVWLVAGASRFAAVLAGRTERQVEQATATGLFVGLALALAILVGE